MLVWDDGFNNTASFAIARGLLTRTGYNAIDEQLNAVRVA
jgi:hypothetical protein